MRTHKNKKQRQREKQERIRNRHLIKEYPWVMPRYWNGRVPKYDYTWTDWELPLGWQKAFGQMMLEELGEEIRKAGLERSIRET